LFCGFCLSSFSYPVLISRYSAHVNLQASSYPNLGISMCCFWTPLRYQPHKSSANNQSFGDLICHHHEGWPSWWWQSMSTKHCFIWPNFYTADSGLVSLFAKKVPISCRCGLLCIYSTWWITAKTRLWSQGNPFLVKNWHWDGIFFEHIFSAVRVTITPIFLFADQPLMMCSSDTESLPVAT
jgi:hypothetical protein